MKCILCDSKFISTKFLTHDIVEDDDLLDVINQALEDIYVYQGG